MGEAQPGRIDLSNISVMEETGETPEEPEKDLLKNGDFSKGDADWITAITAPAAAEVTFSDSKASFDISSLGEEDWSVQLKQAGLQLEKGKTYKVKATFLSSGSRSVKIALLTPATYDWYGGSDIALEAGTEKTVEFTITVEKDTALVDFVISMGKMGEAQPGRIDLGNISVTEVK